MSDSEARAAAPVTYEQSGHVALISLNRPEARNAVNRAVAEAMEAALDRMETDPAIGAGVLRANLASDTDRPVFCAGQDLKTLGTREGNAMRKRGGFAGLAFRERTKPLIAAVDGLATAGGCELVLACDFVIATRRSSFGLAEVRRGLIAGSGGIARLARAVGQSVAMKAVLTGEPITAERAHQLGLVADLVEPADLDSTAVALAAAIAANAPLAIKESRAIVLAAVDGAAEHSLQAMSAEALDRLMSSDDLQEGLRAFAERRPPRWTGR
jgi:enoyl-CoA hydratase